MRDELEYAIESAATEEDPEMKKLFEQECEDLKKAIEILADVISAVGDRADEITVRNLLVNLIYHSLISEREARLILSAVSDTTLRSLPEDFRDRIRADIFKQMLIIAAAE